MNSKALYGAFLLGTVASLFVACGDGDSTKIVICKSKELTCLNAQGGEVCSADGTLKLPFPCGVGETCCDPRSSDDGCTDYQSGEAGGNSRELTRSGCVSQCKPKDTECATDKVSRVCSEDGRAWIPIACPSGTGCDPATGECTRSDDPDDTVTICGPNQATCVDGSTVKDCEEDGSNWVYKPCPTGTTCEDGGCVVDGTVECIPHTGVCASKSLSRICNDAGSGYDDVDCGNTMECIDGLCRGPVCTKGEIRCDDVREGNVIAQLISGTYKPTIRYICNATGTGWDIVDCDQGEICAYDNIAATTINAFIEDIKSELGGLSSSPSNLPAFDIPETSQAQCVVPECAAPFALRELIDDYYFDAATGGSFICGDPPDGADPLASYSLCEGLPPYNNLHWANYVCPPDTQCAYDGAPSVSEGESPAPTGPSCVQTCRPGTKACFQPGIGGQGIIAATGESVVTCDQNGEWDFANAETCPLEGGREQWCGPNLRGDSDYNIGTCMAPACAYWFTAYDTFALPQGTGACGTNGSFYQCQIDGTLGDADSSCSSCAVEVRAPGANVIGSDATYGGYPPGTCLTCVDGQQACVIPYNIGTATGSPFFSVCDAGAWTVDSCADGELCHDYTDLNQSSDTYGLGRTHCGGECTPYSTECGGTFFQQIRTCSRNAAWGDFADCGTGACTDDQTTNFGVASCEAECIRGTFACTGNSEAPCTGDLRFDYENAVACADGEICFDKQGCKECDNGQTSGRPATRCNPDDANQIQACQPDGTWGAAVDCPSNAPVCGGGNPSAVCGPDLGTGGGAGTSGAGGNGGGAGTAGTAGDSGLGGSIGIAGFVGIAGDINQQ